VVVQRVSISDYTAPNSGIVDECLKCDDLKVGDLAFIEAPFRHSPDKTKETLIAGVAVEILCHLVPLLGNVP
jgi:hypothetical protein